MLSLKEFDKIITSVKEKDQEIAAIGDMLGGADRLYRTSMCEEVLALLKHDFQDKDDLIGYWMWELNFGEQWHEGTVTGADGADIPLKTTGDLYKLLLDNMDVTHEVDGTPVDIFETPSGDGLTDFSLTYYPASNDYSMSLETIYGFNNQESVKCYLQGNLDQFTAWMEQNGHDTNKEISLWQIFEHGDGMKNHYRSVEEAYAVFKLLVNGAITVNVVGEDYGNE